MTDGKLVWPGGGTGGGAGQGPGEGGHVEGGRRGKRKREEEEGRGVGECGLGRGTKEMCFFFITAKAENESLTQAWGSRILFVCLCSLMVCLCDLRSREF